MSDLELPSGLVVHDIEQRLQSFLTEEWLYYDGIEDDQPNLITAVDVLAPVFVNAYFSGSAATLRRPSTGGSLRPATHCSLPSRSQLTFTSRTRLCSWSVTCSKLPWL